ncbi:replication restart helicase PriA [Crocinitomix catalasitica]|uniref:replication restart helicase PriA n=1 Tax=Crocinitomix catalasitica TaxID=184607 RepID=UPI0004814802|nr:primosomal protein N' [Crocinitomix catalasitica]
MTERKTYFVDVIIPLSIPNRYTYRVPFELNQELELGKRAIVPFGRSKFYTAIISRIHEEIPKDYTAKYIELILDETPIVLPQQFKLWDWISEYYMADIGDVMNAALPSNFKLASETVIVLHPDYEHNSENLNAKEALILDALELRTELTLKEVGEIVQIKTIQPIIKGLIEKRVAIVSEELKAKYSPKQASFIRLADQYADNDKLSALLNELESNKKNEKQVYALLKIVSIIGINTAEQIPVLKKTLVDDDISNSTLNTLSKKGIIEIFSADISRLKDALDDNEPIKALSPSQETALIEIEEHFKTLNTVLLHGVTSSGKTEVYVKLIQAALEKGEQVLFLLPEIALTTQLINRLRKYFGDLVGVYHSKFNQNERIEIWNHVLNNSAEKYRIVLGARSSVFLPFNNLGLVIVDEEHENSFKQYDPAPRYNARDLAIVLGNMHKAKTLLGSATPSIESYFNAKEGRYGLVELSERFGGVQMPEILVADLEKETKQKTMKSHFSSFLMEKMEESFENKEQVILFQNRRGYNPIWSCELCAWTPQCTQCDVSLTYHKLSNVLKCHYCGYYTSPPSSCGRCGSRKLKMLGFGTEKIEDEFSLFFKDKTIQRMDLDTTRAKNAYEQIINDFEQRNIDVLIGTQMITKGLDFDNVGLVGILSADQLLNFPDFRAFERAYQLMAQVSGRAGRKSKRGKVILQSFNPNHWIIQKVISNDYIGMYTQELVERRNFHYPPFYRLIYIRLRHKNETTLTAGSIDLSKKLKSIFKDRVLGPEAPSVSKVRNYYIKFIVIKFERDASPKKVKDIIKEKINVFLGDHDYRSIRVDIDVDPQ